MRTEKSAIIWIGERARGKPQARHTAAHELGHLKMHSLVDHFQQCEGEQKPHAAYRIEREAHAFAAELVMPEALVAPMCVAERPTLSDVHRLTTKSGASLQSAAIRYVELSKAACAAALFQHQGGGVWQVKWGPETEAFPGRVVLRREPHPKSIAAKLAARGRACDPGPRRVPPEAWGEVSKSGAVKPGTPSFIEHSICFGWTVLTWITPG
jgi:hypothetical protein